MYRQSTRCESLFAMIALQREIMNFPFAIEQETEIFGLRRSNSQSTERVVARTTSTKTRIAEDNSRSNSTGTRHLNWHVMSLISPYFK